MSFMTDITYPEIFAKCKRGSDKLTEGQDCTSNRAKKMSPDGSSVVIFQCLKCNYQWSIPIGGIVL